MELIEAEERGTELEWILIPMLSPSALEHCMKGQGIKKAIMTRELDLLYKQLRQRMHMYCSSFVLDTVAMHDNATDTGHVL